jgi:hypothetical protein
LIWRPDSDLRQVRLSITPEKEKTGVEPRFSVAILNKEYGVEPSFLTKALKTSVRPRFCDPGFVTPVLDPGFAVFGPVGERAVALTDPAWDKPECAL